MPKAALLLIPILAAALLIWFFNRSEPAGFGTATPEELATEEGNKALPPQPRVALPEERAAETPPAREVEAEKPTEEGAVDEGPAVGQGRLRLEVSDRLSGDPVYAFNLVMIAPGQDRVDRLVEGSSLEIDVPLDLPFSINIEATGFEPRLLEGVEIDAKESALSLPIQLERILEGTGVSLEVRDHLFLPVSRIRLSLSSRDLQSREEDYALLWQREAESEVGVFPLPELAAAHYLFAIQALDEQGELAPFMLVEHKLSYYGAETVPIPIQLRHGALLSLEVRDQSGQRLGSDVVMRLENAEGEHIETRWLATEDESTLEALDMLPSAQTCRLGQVLAPGRYLLRLQSPLGNLDHPFEVRGGQKLDLRLQY
ncbi:MAG: hypothetical protein ACYTG5_06655 [Planctomycetota bacterium]|jgi:hypothetical protein